jgi:hypothetical protein
MIGRRSFFKRIAAAVAVVALAPQLAFRQNLDLPSGQFYTFEVNRNVLPGESIDAWIQRQISEEITSDMSKHLAKIYART